MVGAAVGDGVFPDSVAGISGSGRSPYISHIRQTVAIAPISIPAATRLAIAGDDMMINGITSKAIKSHVINIGALPLVFT